MAVTSNRDINIQFTGDLEYQQTFESVESVTSPGVIENVDLTTGDNTITVPDDAVAVTIIKPSDNDVVLILKGIGADTGITLSLIDPDSLSLDTVTSFVINVSGAVTLRLIFT